jgi:hypothetical protein
MVALCSLARTCNQQPWSSKMQAGTMHVTFKRLTCACHMAALRAFSVFEILYPYLQTVVLGANVLAGQSALLPGQYSATSQGPWAFLHHKHSPTHGSRGVDRKMSTPSGKCKPRETHWAFVKFCNALYGAGCPLQNCCM